MARRKSRAEAAIEAQLQTLEPGTERYEVLESAREFKAAWVSLGDRLTQVRETEVWRAWGHKTFEAYCRTELHVRRDTANKLTRSFAFLRDHEPAVLEEGGRRELPPLDVVDLLSRAPERTKVSGEDFDAIRREVFDPESGQLSRNQVLKKFRELDPDAFRSQRAAVPRGEGSSQDIRKALLLAERLEGLLTGQEGLSEQAIKGVKRAANELRQLFEATQDQAATG